MFFDDGDSSNDRDVILFDGLSVPSTLGTAVTNGALWDFLTFDVTTLLSPGVNNLNITTGQDTGALSTVHIAIDLPAAAAPPVDSPVSVPEPTSLALLGLGLAEIAYRQYRRKKSANLSGEVADYGGGAVVIDNFYRFI